MQRSRRSGPAGACLLGLGIGLALAPAPLRAGEAPEAPDFRDRVDVTVVNVAASVVDRTGAPLRGLERGDFRLVVDGVPTEISNFAAVPDAAPEGDAPPPPAAAPRYLAVLLDTRSGSPRERDRAAGQLETAVGRLLAQGWSVTVAAADEEFHATGAFAGGGPAPTARLRELAAARVQPSALAAERQSLLNGMDDISIGQPGRDDGGGLALDVNEARGVLQRIRALARAQRQQGRARVARLGAAVAELGRLPGTRCLVYVGDGLEAQPSSDLFLLWAGRYPQVALREMRKPELEAGQYSLATESIELARAAAGADVTVYYVPTARWAGAASGDADREGAETLSDLTSSSSRAPGDVLADLAHASGGARLDVGKGDVARLADELGARYTIGFAAPQQHGEEGHRVRLTVARPGAAVRHRASFRVASLSERMVEATLAGLLGAPGDGANPLGATAARREEVARGEGRVDLTVAVIVPMRSLALVPERSAHRGEVTIFYAAAGAGGRPIEVRSASFPVLVANEELFTTLGQDAAFTVTVTVEAGTDRLAFTVLDTVSQLVSTVTLPLGDGADAG